MKKLAVLLLLPLLFIFPVAALAVTSEDYSVINNRLVTLPSDEVVNRDYFGFGEIVELSGTVNGDAYLAGGQIFVNGTVNGDLLVAGGQITLNGDIKQDLRVVGGQITLNGSVGGNITVAGGNIDIAKEGLLAGNVVVAGGNLNLASPVAGDLKIAAGNATISNRVEGDVLAGVGHMLVTSTGLVGGDLVYWGESESAVELAGQATVSGQLVFRATPTYFQEWQQQAKEQSFSDSVKQGMNTFRLIALAGSLIVGFLMIHLLPNWSVATIKAIENKGWATGFMGFAALILTPFVIFFLMASIIGLPTAGLLLALYLMALYISRIVFAYWLGARLLNRLSRQADKTVTLIIGLGLYHVLASIALIGPIVMFLSLVLGLGALLTTDRDTYLKLRRHRLV